MGASAGEGRLNEAGGLSEGFSEVTPKEPENEQEFSLPQYAVQADMHQALHRPYACPLRGHSQEAERQEAKTRHLVISVWEEIKQVTCWESWGLSVE